MSAISAQGPELIEQVVSLTGLPESLIGRELNEILALSGKDQNTLTLDQLRLALLEYMESLHDSEFLSDSAAVSDERPAPRVIHTKD